VLSDLIKEILERLSEPLQKKQMMVRTCLSPAADHLRADRNQIEQVLSEIIGNAIEASPKDGSYIDLTTTESFHHEQGIMIRVKYAGTGMSLEELPPVFVSFFTSGKPHGLGMTICKNIIERHRGNIHLTSTVGIGTIASIWLPIIQEFQGVPGDSMRADIVVADNEQMTREAILKRLRRQGHHAVGYESGETLLAGLQHSLPDLVLLDLKMPGLSGLETLKHVRQLAPAAIVIMLTAYGTMQDAMETMKLGAYDFMIKSVDLKALDVVIARALEVLRLRRQLADRTSNLSMWGLAKT